MKTRYWIIGMVLLLLLCIALSVPMLLPSEAAIYAEISTEGTVVRIVDLRIDQEFTVQAKSGSNTVTVKDGSIAVTAATCPDHYCMERGYCNSGSPIVCLPNRLVIRFSGEMPADSIDAVVG